ncbi:MBL fold metallo-hydrolase [Streptomyces sp. HC44]|uniref:MBL fold metallo-hydrolase n=1 Tax=Streptomyces scabichelini TaxID=2711217 RepID=A0A6G4VJI6_9ACTN|nr:MBL fold metallo-hydrolase [Streptomyces scabichelini]NGO14279.1 MBL fold metallo-hydrolase [Streptomyces scabichelini]
MDTRIDEIAEGIYRISTHFPEIAPPAGFTFNQFLVAAEEPLIFHTGMRATFPAVSEAIGRVLPVERLRWVTFGHVEADECGAMNEFLAAAPHAEVAHNALGCAVTLNDLASRPPRPMNDGESLDIGGSQVRRIVRNINTPHVPHNWESRLLFEERTRTLFCGDLFTHIGNGPAVTGDNLVELALESEETFRQISCLTATTTALRSLADLRPTTLAVMHGSSFNGDCAGALKDLADALESRFGPEAAFVSRPDVVAEPHPGLG